MQEEHEHLFAICQTNDGHDELDVQHVKGKFAAPEDGAAER